MKRKRREKHERRTGAAEAGDVKEVHGVSDADGVHPEPPALEKILNRLLPISYNAGAIPHNVRVAQGQSDGLI